MSCLYFLPGVCLQLSVKVWKEQKSLHQVIEPNRNFFITVPELCNNSSSSEVCRFRNTLVIQHITLGSRWSSVCQELEVQMMMAPAMHRPLMLSLSLQSPNKMGVRKRRRVRSVPRKSNLVPFACQFQSFRDSERMAWSLTVVAVGEEADDQGYRNLISSA